MSLVGLLGVCICNYLSYVAMKLPAQPNQQAVSSSVGERPPLHLLRILPDEKMTLTLIGKKVTAKVEEPMMKICLSKILSSSPK
jgi:hypothetical protein